MTSLRLNDEWTRLLDDYREAHRDPRNQACHKIGIPMIMASIPIGATVVGLPLAAGLFTVGWGFQFLGHYFEGNDPAFFGRSPQSPGRRPLVDAEGGRAHHRGSRELAERRRAVRPAGAPIVAAQTIFTTARSASSPRAPSRSRASPPA
ncbi:MAG: DUF962 domain-containing protein [Minicystis sp.]